MPKEASRWARFNGAHNFGVSTPLVVKIDIKTIIWQFFWRFQTLSQEPYVWSDFTRCQNKFIDEPDSMVPITLWSAPPGGENWHQINYLTVFWRFQPLSQEPYVRSDFARCQKKCLDEPDSMVPITLGSPPPLVVKIGIKGKKTTILARFAHARVYIIRSDFPRCQKKRLDEPDSTGGENWH